mgnify:CR=1 FL=1
MIQKKEAKIHLICQEGAKMLSDSGVMSSKQEAEDLWKWAQQKEKNFDDQLLILAFIIPE